MNYYLARDGQTYGPYPQESFPGMIQQGQVVPTDLVCPEGGSEWVELNKVPGLSGAAPPRMPGLVAPPVASSSKSAGTGPAMPTVAASSASARPAVAVASVAPAVAVASAAPAVAASGPPKLRISMASTSHGHAAATPAAAPVHTNYPQATYPQAKPSLMEKAAGAWGALKIVGYAAVAVLIVVGVIIGFVASKRDKKEIAKLHSEPGWAAFNAANSQINSEDTTAGYGNNGETQKFAELLANAIELEQRANFPPPKKSRYRGRSKLGRVVSAVNSATDGLGSPQTYVDKKGSQIIALIHVPEFSRYSAGTRMQLSETCWETTHDMLSAAMKMREQMSVTPPPANVPTNRYVRPGSRPPSGRPPPGAAAVATAPAPKPAPKPPAEFTLVVGVRGKSSYECVFVGKVTASGNESVPTPIKKNVPSHQELVKWFGTDNSGKQDTP